MIRNLSPRTRTALATATAVVLGIALVTLLPRQIYAPPQVPLPPKIEIQILLKLFFTTVNLILLFILATAYFTLYRDLPNKYTRSLVLLAFALLLYAFTANPLVQIVFGFIPQPQIGAFGYLPDLFLGIAIVILLYQSQT